MPLTLRKSLVRVPFSCSNNAEAHKQLQQTYGSADVVRPGELVTIGDVSLQQSAADRALCAAFGATLIASNDEIATTLVREHGVRCVTFGGSVHERGKLQGGFRDTTQAGAFAALLEQQRAQVTIAALQKRLAALAAWRDALQRVTSLEACSETAAVAETTCAAHVAELEERLVGGGCDDEVYATASSVEEHASRAALATSSLSSLRDDARALMEFADGSSREKVGTLLKQLAASAYERMGERQRANHQCEEALAKLDEMDEGAGGMEIESMELAAEEREQHDSLTEATEQLQARDSDLFRAEQRWASAQSAASTSMLEETAIRDEARRLRLRLDEANSAVDAASAEAEALARSAPTSLPEVVRTWAKMDAAESDCEEGLDGSESDPDSDDERGGEGSSGCWPHIVGISAEEMQSSEGQGQAALNKLATDLTTRLQQGQLLLSSWERQRQELEKKDGTPASLRAFLAASVELDAGVSAGIRECDAGGDPTVGGVEGDATDGSTDRHRNGQRRLRELEQLQCKASTVSESIEALENGIAQTRERVAVANGEAFTSVRAATISIFGSLVPTMEIDIECDDPPNLGECGARFRVRSKAARRDAEWRPSLQELSGGQRTLLNLSLLLAIAQYRPTMLLLMDEVDAALDECNAARVAELLKQISAKSQVLAISHRAEFLRLADQQVRLHKEREYTVVGCSQ